MVSDHGMAPFHTAVSLGNLLRNAGIDLEPRSASARPGPPTHVYVNLQGREAPSGTQVPPAEYAALVADIAQVLREATDPNPFFNPRERRCSATSGRGRTTAASPASARTGGSARTAGTCTR